MRRTRRMKRGGMLESQKALAKTLAKKSTHYPADMVHRQGEPIYAPVHLDFLDPEELESFGPVHQRVDTSHIQPEQSLTGSRFETPANIHSDVQKNALRKIMAQQRNIYTKQTANNIFSNGGRKTRRRSISRSISRTRSRSRSRRASRR